MITIFVFWASFSPGRVSYPETETDGSLVITVTCAGALHVGFGTATQWGILVDHWGDESVWTNTPWSSSLGPFTSGLSECCALGHVEVAYSL